MPNRTAGWIRVARIMDRQEAGMLIECGVSWLGSVFGWCSATIGKIRVLMRPPPSSLRWVSGPISS